MKYFILPLLLSFVLTSCSLMPWTPDDDAEVLTFLPANQLNQWDLTAKFSVSTSEGTESGSIRWILKANEERLDVLSPTGSVIAQLVLTESEARLKTDDGESVASDAETLFKDVMNLSLPISALRFWVRGLTAPNLTLQSVKKDAEGRIIEILQDGWRLSYNGNISIESGSNLFEVPRRLNAIRNDVEIRWASTEWQAITQ